MYLEIEGFLTPEEVSEVRQLAADTAFEDGLASNPHARTIKRNEQMNDEAGTARLGRIVTNAATRSQAFQLFAQPARLRAPLLSRYTEGMAYGRHLDSPVLPGRDAMRTDLSMTVFVSDEDAYEGGALLLDTYYGEIACRLPAGSAVVYATSVWHEVEEVTRGERLAAVTWIQSRVADPGHRALLADVGSALAEVAGAAPGSDAAERLQRAYFDMQRRWSGI